MMNEIETICQLIRDAEWSRNIQYMQSILSDELVFRRANGTFADKSGYLDGLADIHNTYDLLQNDSCKVEMNDEGDIAIATVMVRASGKRGQKQVPFSGVYKNIRVFKKVPEWKLFMWHNETISNNMIVFIPKAEAGKINYMAAEALNFTGNALIESISGVPGSPHPRALHVKFENGACTKWHFHSMMQILLVTEGLGFVQQKGYPAFDIHPGDRIYIPQNTWHIHGAKAGATMVHLAITTGETTWEKEQKL